MPVDESYRKQVSLLVKIVPLVAKETVFALKGPHLPSCQGPRVFAQGD
jgi:hypothetical protein